MQQVTKYRGFKAMLENEGLKKCLPDCANIEAGVEAYQKLYRIAENSGRRKSWDFAVGVIALRVTTDLSTEGAVEPRPVAYQAKTKMRIHEGERPSRSRSRKRMVSASLGANVDTNEVYKQPDASPNDKAGHVDSRIEMWA